MEIKVSPIISLKLFPTLPPKIQPFEMYTIGPMSRSLWMILSKNSAKPRHMRVQMESLSIRTSCMVGKRLTFLLEQERLYGKDGDCPAEWTEWLAHSGAIPDDLLFHGSNDFLKFLPNKVYFSPLFPFSSHRFRPRSRLSCAIWE